jgi:hypothetical protein
MRGSAVLANKKEEKFTKYKPTTKSSSTDTASKYVKGGALKNVKTFSTGYYPSMSTEAGHIS